MKVQGVAIIIVLILIVGLFTWGGINAHQNAEEQNALLQPQADNCRYEIIVKGSTRATYVANHYELMGSSILLDGYYEEIKTIFPYWKFHANKLVIDADIIEIHDKEQK